ncbi:class II aldolase/adducin family protein [Candidatus Micrarchaeota archaeon]|nr:class II aldolase/adducin family protein [Candidatus Micrarchaeota archaeon]
MEKYKGVKFKIKEVEAKFNSRPLVELDKEIAGYFQKPVGNEGNLSIRKNKGFLIKKAGIRMGEITEQDVSLVFEANSSEVVCSNPVPSSESIMHYNIYRERPEIKIILHFHDDELLKRIERIPNYGYGTKKQAEAVSRALQKKNVVGIEKHGIVIIGKNKKEIIEGLKKVYSKT